METEEGHKPSTAYVKSFIVQFENLVTEHVSEGRPVLLTGFARFYRNEVPPRKAGRMISPFTKEEVEVKARAATARPKVSLLKKFKDAVADGYTPPKRAAAKKTTKKAAKKTTKKSGGKRRRPVT